MALLDRQNRDWVDCQSPLQQFSLDRMTLPFTACLASLGMLLTLPALAHGPYEHIAGHFQRGDGKEVTIVEAYVDGLLGADPQSTRFQLTDGTVIAATPYGAETLAWVGGNRVDLYTYEHSWLPLATAVRHFDGYTIKEGGSAGETVFSFWVHLHRKWPIYGILLGGAALIRVAAAGIKRIRINYSSDFVQWLAIGAVCLVTASYSLVVLVAGISPPFLAVAGIGLYFTWWVGSRLLFK